MPKIFVYPPLIEPQALSNIVCRLAWYFKPYINSFDSIHLTSTRAMLNQVGLAPMLDSLIEGDLDAIKDKFQLMDRKDFATEISAIDPATDMLLIWDESSEQSAPEAVKSAIRVLGPKRGLYRVDPQRTRMEGSFYLWAGLNKYGDHRALTACNRDRMRRMVAEVGRHEKAYVFGSGPTLSDYVENHDFSDGICIISNSIVKNREIIARTRPRIITAADPLYHAGCSSYAGAFRNELIHALRETAAWFVCPMRDFAIYNNFLPADLREHIIGIPFNKDGAPPTDLVETFYLKPYPNILTLALLPIASSIARKIEIVGCDGRNLTDDSFFWSHDKKAQFNDKMADIQATHPAFFAIDYNDYYTEHCRDVEEVLSAMEASSKRVVTATPSMIPALHAREISAPRPAEVKAQALVMIDPDAKDDWGHFLAYDERLAEGCHDLETDFVLICRRELDPKFFPDRANLVFPTLSVHSWTVGKDWPRTRRGDVMIFAKELDEALVQLEERIPTGEICIFMYIGSIEAAEVLEHLLIHRPRFRAVVNLFWSYNFDQNDYAYRQLWQGTVRRLTESGQIRLMHATSQIAAEYRRDWAVELPVLPHPSTTFDDRAAQTLTKLPPATPGTPRRVLFPGGTRKEKGFVLSARTCTLLAKDPQFTLALRARIDQVSGNELEVAIAELKAAAGSAVEILDGDLSDDDFVDMISTADIVVIPYLPDAFRRRTSGILVDAFLLGKPVVVLKDTWLADIVESGYLGLCADPTPESLAEALQTLSARYADFLPGVARMREDYLRQHSWTTLARKVLQCASFVVPKPRAEMTKARQDALEKELKALVAKLPTRAPIYLPTEKISTEDQIKGLTRVKRIYDTGLKDVYSPRLRALRAKYRGTRRCFVIGNGPSLNETDLSLLKDEVTFAVNGFFLKARELDWTPTFYVVEDHLVAEDRAKWINAFKGPIKLFPAYLGYMFPEAPDTIFYNHRPRKSYPHGFDFSTRADEITYTGATVTFSMLQLAFYMGFEEIYMIGVDASYAIPEDAQQASSYSVGVIDMQSDDVNHFHPDYFGKGFRWHDPQVSKMVEAYAEARRVVDQTTQRIYNATVGGQLEVFERRDYKSLFPPQRSLETNDYPKLLILDLTPIGNGTATGEIKYNLLKGWPNHRLLQVSFKGPKDIALSRGRLRDTVSELVVKPTEADAIIDAFDADVVMYRPVPNARALHDYAMPLLARLGKPLVTWIMDDWPQHLQASDPEQFASLNNDFEHLLAKSDTRLSICHAMSVAMCERYGLPFRSLANGVDPAEWQNPKVHEPGTMVVRYAGGLEPNMTRSSVLRISRAVEKLAESGCNIRFEINTRAYYYQPNLETFSRFKHTRFTNQTKSANEYRYWLKTADVSLIAYNFDQTTKNYVRYSMANKMPECLASGSVLLAHGPKDYATIDYLAGIDGAVVVTDDSDEAVELALRVLQEDPARRAEIANRGRATAFTRHNVFKLRETLREIMIRASLQQKKASLPSGVVQKTMDKAACRRLITRTATFLLLEPSATLRRLEIDIEFRDSIETALRVEDNDKRLRTHFVRCRAHALNKQKNQP